MQTFSQAMSSFIFPTILSGTGFVLALLVKVAQSCPTLCDPMDYSPWNSPGQNTGVGSLSLLQGIFPIQESAWGLPVPSPGIFPIQESSQGLPH